MRLSRFLPTPKPAPVPPAPAPRILILPRDYRDEDLLTEADLRRLFHRAEAERPEWYRAVRQVIHQLSTTALNDVTDASLPTEQLHRAAGGFANLSALLAEFEAYGKHPTADTPSTSTWPSGNESERDD